MRYSVYLYIFTYNAAPLLPVTPLDSAVCRLKGQGQAASSGPVEWCWINGQGCVLAFIPKDRCLIRHCYRVP